LCASALINNHVLLAYTLVITAARFSLPHEPFFLAVSALMGEEWFIHPVWERVREV
jgi:hypothetical protein